MKASIYIGHESGKAHLEVNGVTLATEGDLCRDSMFRAMGCDRWTPEDLQRAASLINTRKG